ncbi:MAG: ATP-binding protein, partial [Verrucomicrobiota bacterium]
RWRYYIIVSLIFFFLGGAMQWSMWREWQTKLKPRALLEAQFQASVLVESQAALLALTASSNEGEALLNAVSNVIGGILDLQSPTTETNLFHALRLDLDAGAVNAPVDDLNRSWSAGDVAQGFSVEVPLVPPGKEQPLGRAEFQVSDLFYTQLAEDLRKTLLTKSITDLALLAYVWILAVLLIKAVHRSQKRAEAASVAKSAFLANMSHEIRTPLNGVIGMTGLLIDTPIYHDKREYATSAYKSGESLLTLINDILDFSKIEAGKLDFENVDFDLRLTIEDIVQLLGVKAQEKKLELILQIDTKLPLVVRGDAGRVRQILMNLTNNAIKFTEKGEVLVAVEVEHRSLEEVKIRFSVSDTGIGIPEDKLGDIFSAFSQVDASTTRIFGGTGLGLAISKELCERMGGRIGVESTPEIGSTFWFEL